MAGIDFRSFFRKVNPVTNHTVRTILISAATAIAMSLGANPAIVEAVGALLGAAPTPAPTAQTQPAQ